MPALLPFALSSGNLELHTNTERIVFLVFVICGGFALTWFGISMIRGVRRADAPPDPIGPLTGIFGGFLAFVGAATAVLSLYFLIGGLSGWGGITDLRH